MQGKTVDLKALINGQQMVDGVSHSAELLGFVDTVLKVQSGVVSANDNKSSMAQNAAELDQARVALREVLTDAAFVDACATVASFNAVVKVADATGIPLEDDKAERTVQLRADLRIDELRDKGYIR